MSHMNCARRWRAELCRRADERCPRPEPHCRDAAGDRSPGSTGRQLVEMTSAEVSSDAQEFAAADWFLEKRSLKTAHSRRRTPRQSRVQHRFQSTIEGDPNCFAGRSRTSCATLSATRPKIRPLSQPRRLPNGVIIRVRDYGPGVPEDMLGAFRFFLPRRRISRRSRRRCWSGTLNRSPRGAAASRQVRRECSSVSARDASSEQENGTLPARQRRSANMHPKQQ